MFPDAVFLSMVQYCKLRCHSLLLMPKQNSRINELQLIINITKQSLTWMFIKSKYRVKTVLNHWWFGKRRLFSLMKNAISPFFRLFLNTVRCNLGKQTVKDPIGCQYFTISSKETTTTQQST